MHPDTNKPASFFRTLAAVLITVSGLSQIATLWLRDLSGMAIANALLGAVYLLIAIGLFGQSRFSLFMAILIPATVSGSILLTAPHTENIYTLRMVADGVVVLFSSLELWRVRHNQSV